MYLGVYWYYGFPTGLYDFDYFSFSRGLGGHADNPAELTATLRAPATDALLRQLATLVNRHPEGWLFVRRYGLDTLRISTGGHQLTDYDFMFAQAVEALLGEAGAELVAAPGLAEPTQTLRLAVESTRSLAYPRQQLLQLVSTGPGRYNAETLALRLDCHLSRPAKEDFIGALAAVAREGGLQAFYYFEKVVAGTVNLMLFFTNGRQGIGLQAKRYTEVAPFESAVAAVLQQYQAREGHRGGLASYPREGPTIELMVDQDFVLG